MLKYSFLMPGNTMKRFESHYGISVENCLIKHINGIHTLF